MAIEAKFKITEIISLRCKDLSTGRARVFKPEDFTENPEQWARLVEEAETNPKGFEIHRDEVLGVDEQESGLAKVKPGDLYRMSREKVSEVCAFYGITDEGQKRNVLIDLLVPEIRAAQKARAESGEAGADEESGD